MGERLFFGEQDELQAEVIQLRSFIDKEHRPELGSAAEQSEEGPGKKPGETR